MTKGFGRIVVMASVVFVAFSARAHGQEFGVRTGMNVNPDQFSGGAQYGMPLSDKLWFQPSVDLGLGDGASLVTLASHVVYRHRMGHRSAWTLFGGGGPELDIYRVAGVQDTFAGVTAFGGAEHASGLFVQCARGFLDSPRMRLGVGYVFHPHAPRTKAAPRR